MQQTLAHFRKGERSLGIFRLQPVNQRLGPGLCAFEDFPCAVGGHSGPVLGPVRVRASGNLIASGHFKSCGQPCVLIRQQRELPRDAMTRRIRRKSAKKFSHSAITESASNKFRRNRIFSAGHHAAGRARQQQRGNETSDNPNHALHNDKLGAFAERLSNSRKRFVKALCGVPVNMCGRSSCRFRSPDPARSTSAADRSIRRNASLDWLPAYPLRFLSMIAAASSVNARSRKT